MYPSMTLPVHFHTSEQQHTDMCQTLVTQGRSKLEKSQEDSQAPESALSDNAKGLITETFLSTFIYARRSRRSRSRLDFFSLYHFIGLCRSAAESPSSFLLIGRWLPNTKKKKKKSVSVPRCPRCNMWQWTCFLSSTSVLLIGIVDLNL